MEDPSSERGKRQRDDDVVAEVATKAPTTTTTAPSRQDSSTIFEDVTPVPPTAPTAIAAASTLSKQESSPGSVTNSPAASVVSPLTPNAATRPATAPRIKSAPAAPGTSYLSKGVVRPPSLVLAGGGLSRAVSSAGGSAGTSPVSGARPGMAGVRPGPISVVRPSPLAGVKSAPMTPASALYGSRPGLAPGWGAPATAAPAAGGFAERMARVFAKALATSAPSEAGGTAAPDTPPVTAESADVKERALEIGHAVMADPNDNQQTALKISSALKDPKNHVLRSNVLLGSVSPAELVKMTEHELANPEIQKKNEADYEERMRHRNWTELKKSKQNITNLFRCPKCGKNECSMIHKQTRSGDEPMTALLTCTNCGKVFRRQA